MGRGLQSLIRKAIRSPLQLTTKTKEIMKILIIRRKLISTKLLKKERWTTAVKAVASTVTRKLRAFIGVS